MRYDGRRAGPLWGMRADKSAASKRRSLLSLNRRLRDAFVHVHQSLSRDHAKRIIAEWRRDDNATRTHRALGGLPTDEFVEQLQATTTATAASLW